MFRTLRYCPLYELLRLIDDEADMLFYTRSRSYVEYSCAFIPTTPLYWNP